MSPRDARKEGDGMNVQQKVAWFNIAVFVAALALYGALVPLIGASRALGAYGVLGLWGLGFFFYRRPKSGVLMDERDQLVNARAQVAGLWIFWEFFVAACMITWAVLRYFYHSDIVSVEVLPLMVVGGMVIFVLSYSIAILFQYRTGRSHESA
jgi:hypothetical protein